MRKKRFLTLVVCLFFWMTGPNSVVAEDDTVSSSAEADVNNKVTALEAILDIRASLNESLKGYREKLKDAVSETEKTNLLAKIADTEKELAEAEQNFEEIATDIDLSAIQDQPDSVLVK